MRFALLFASAVAAIAATSAVAGDKRCQLVKVAEWNLWQDHYRPIVDGAVNGQKVGILLDTGTFATFIRQAAATKLGLTLAPVTSGHGRIDGIRSYGIEGERRSEGAYISELRIGDAVRKDWLARITPVDSGDDIAVVLGYEFFHQLDVEFDLAHNVVRLFEPKDCERASLAYWAKDAIAVPLESGPRLQLWVAVNGKPLLAELETGTSVTVLSLEAATVAGLEPQSAGAAPGGCLGSRKNGLDTWFAQLDSFSVGDEVIRQPKIRVTDLWRNMKADRTWSSLPRRLQGLADVVLGVDFLRAHRVYVAHSQSKLYFSYVGGTVFPARAGKPCSQLPD